MPKPTKGSPEPGSAVRCQRDFDVPYQGTTTFYKADQVVTDPEEIAYLWSVKAPVTKEEN